jgi:sporulation protein YlmC with PRC-barrel domain
MEQQGNTNNYLEELSKSDFEIVENEPNIIGWKVINENGTYIGEIKELLFDNQTNAVRYLIIDLTANGMHLDDKK